MYKLRKTKIEDINDILIMYEDARTNMKMLGFNQWKDGYPNETVLLNDMKNNESFVFLKDDEVIASAMISTRPEITYNVINGLWGNDEPYYVIHRFVVKKEYLRIGIASLFLSYIEKSFNNITIRTDTHENNYLMKGFLLKNGFVYRGIITLLNGELRDAYDKIKLSGRKTIK